MGIKVYNDRRVRPTFITVANQHENMTRTIDFDFIDCMQGHRYLILTIDGKSTPFLILGDKLNITSVISQNNVKYLANIVISDKEITDRIDPDNILFISDTFYIKIQGNDINVKEISEFPIPPELQLPYDELLDLIEKIDHKLSDGEFNGKSAYEIAVENGFEGTEEEWLQSLDYEHSDEFTQLATQVRTDAEQSAQNATKAENAMNEANQTAQDNIEAIQQASAQAQEDITNAKTTSVNAVVQAQQTAEQSIAAKHSEAVQAIESAQSTAETAINAKQAESVNAVETAKEEATQAIETGKTEAVTAIETAKDEAIEEIENTGVPLEDIEKLAIKPTQQGNPTIISDSADWRLQKLNVYGQSEQASTTGAQLLNPNLFESNDITKNGIRFVKNSDGSITISGTSTGFSTYNLGINQLENGTYFINGTKDNVYVYAGIKKADSESFIENNSFSIDGTETSINIYIQVNPGFTVNDIIYPMLNLGDTVKPFEPYTGVKPSPSPDYPQEILSKEVSEIKIYGTNLFDLEKAKLAPNTNWNEERQCFYPKGVAYYIGILINEVWDIAHESGNLLTVSFDIKADKNGKVKVYSLGNRQVRLASESEYVDVTQEYVRHYVRFSTLDKRGQPDDTGQGDNCALSFYGVVNGDSVIPEVKNICISITENTDYIPFEAQTITLTEPITLRGVPVSSDGNVTIDGQQYVSDVICEKDGVIGVERNVIKPTIAENLTFTQTPDNLNRTSNWNTFSDLNIKETGSEAMSNYFVWRAWGNNSMDRNSWVFGINGHTLYITPPRKSDGNYAK